MKGKKNDFSMTFYNKSEKILHLGFVHDTKKAVKWANDNKKVWTHANIYNRRTREFLARSYPDNIL